ncbi:MAG: hypothetical protein HPZ79_07755 [Oscillospiraceae bacterium]|nr:hypothetical protein [Oscillospiraceae bacterium]
MNCKLLKCLGKAAVLGVGGAAALFGVYWFNLDNKLIFYGVRPILNKLYDRQQRDVKL